MNDAKIQRRLANHCNTRGGWEGWAQAEIEDELRRAFTIPHTIREVTSVYKGKELADLVLPLRPRNNGMILELKCENAYGQKGVKIKAPVHADIAEQFAVKPEFKDYTFVALVIAFTPEADRSLTKIGMKPIPGASATVAGSHTMRIYREDYKRSCDPSYAVNTGYYYGNDKYDVINVASYEITNPSTGGIASQASSSSAVAVSSSTTSPSSSSTTICSMSTAIATPIAFPAPIQGPCGTTSYVSRSGSTYSQTYIGCGLDNVNDSGTGHSVRSNQGASLCDARNYCANSASGLSSDYAPNEYSGFTLYQYADDSLVCIIYVNGQDAAASAYTQPDQTVVGAYGYSRG